MTTKIEWADDVWEPDARLQASRAGLRRLLRDAHRSPGPLVAHRGLTVVSDHGIDWTGELRLLADRLDIPLRRRKPTRWFVDSMSDLFHPQVPAEFIGSVWNTMALADQHTFQVLTKRPNRMAAVLIRWAEDGWMWRRHDQMWCGPLPAPLPNVWLGTSIELDEFTWRADAVRATPAAVRWLSLEPLLGPLPSLDLTGIDWVVVGGESGPRARPLHPDWVRDIRDRCLDLGVPFFFKQWGAWLPADDHDPRHRSRVLGGYWAHEGRWADLTLPGIAQTPAWVLKLGKDAAGRTLDDRTWAQLPQLAEPRHHLTAAGSMLDLLSPESENAEGSEHMFGPWELSVRETTHRGDP